MYSVDGDSQYLRLSKNLSLKISINKKKSNLVTFRNLKGAKLFEPKNQDTNDVIFKFGRAISTKSFTGYDSWVYFWLGISDIKKENQFTFYRLSNVFLKFLDCKTFSALKSKF